MEATLCRATRWLGASALALFAVGFLLWFGGLVAGHVRRSPEEVDAAWLAAGWAAGIGAAAALGSVVLALCGWYKTRRPHPWLLIVGLWMGFPLVVAVGVAYFVFAA